MKKNIILFLILIFHTGLALFAQDFRDAKIYVPPVTGTGRHQDNIFFYRRLTEEVLLQHYSLVRAYRDSDYILIGYIEPDNDSSQEFVFTVELQNSATSEMIAKQDITYRYVENTSVDEFLSIIVYNMLSGIPDIEVSDYWRDKWVYLNAGVIWIPKVYIGDYQSVYFANFGVALQAEVQFLNFMSFQTGASFAQEWVITSSNREEYYRDMIFEIPIALKFIFKPFDSWMIEPYGGVHFNFSLMNTTKPSSISWMTGLQLGIKAGPGMVTIDTSFSMDFGASYIVKTSQQYKRYTLQIGVGYKFGFFPKKGKKRDY